MNVDDQMGSCRDKGRIWGRVGALCLSWWQRDPVGTAWSKQVAPQPGQAQGLLIHSTPPLVPTGPWAASTSMDMITRFGRQHSVGLDLSAAEELSRSFEPCLSIPDLTFGPESRDKCYNSNKYGSYSKKCTTAIYNRGNALFNTPHIDTTCEKDIF